jgi:glycerophosphoryl diester phosphodiesterase
VWSHRGRGGGQPDNTLEAFRWVRDAGVAGVELDVHLSADGVPVVHHDPVVAGAGPLAELRAAELPVAVPPLVDVLALGGTMLMNVEMKVSGSGDRRRPDALAVAVVDAVVASGRADHVVLSSFSSEHLDAAARALDGAGAAGSGVRLGWLVPPGVDPLGVVDAASRRGYDALHPFVAWVGHALVEAARDASLAVHVWTVNAPGDLRSMVEMGVDAIITDLPLAALATLAGPG